MSFGRSVASGLRGFGGGLIAAFVRKTLPLTIGLLAIVALLQRPARAEEFDLLHLWRTESERQAVAVLRQAVEREGLVWREHVVDGNFLGVRARFSERVALRRPPSAVFWIGGRDIGSMIDEGLFRAVRTAPGQPKLKEFLVPEVLQMVAYGDGYTAVPVGIHLQNFVVYNRSIFDKLSLKTPRSWQEFLAAAPTILKAGYAPLSMSDQLWQVRFLFASILAEQMSDSELNALLDRSSVASPAVRTKLRRALEIFAQLRPFTNANYRNLDWEKVALAVKNNEAAAVVMGDFLAPLFADDRRFECGLAPGSKFVQWSLDVLVFPRAEDDRQTVAQDAAIRAWTQPSVLRQYVAKKGGVSVVAAPSTEGQSVCAQQSAVAWASGVPRVTLVNDLWTGQLSRLSSIASELLGNAPKPIDEVTELMLVALKSH